jgi:hypothetical protein
MPLIRWTFREGTAPPDGFLHGGAVVVGDRLRLDKETQSYFESTSIPESIREKTLEAWVVLTDLAQGGGAAISIESTADRDRDLVVRTRLDGLRRLWPDVALLAVHIERHRRATSESE